MATDRDNLQKFDHLVVLMLENRSFDNLVGYLYEDDSPSQFLPADDAVYRGLQGQDDLWNPDDQEPPARIPVRKAPWATPADMCNPYPCPGEVYAPNINRQLYGTDVVPTDIAELPSQAPMQGFVQDFIRVIGQSTRWDGDLKATPERYRRIMDCFPPPALPVFSGLARHFALSDAWYSSAPTETFPNRSFVHAATSLGKVNNSHPTKWAFGNSQTTIFQRLSQRFEQGQDWRVYWDESDITSITRLLHQPLQDARFAPNFRFFRRFQEDCLRGDLPAYSFIEPRVFVNPNDMHPPFYLNPLVDSSLLAGELLINEVYDAVRQGKLWDRTLLIITFDEHGGCYDHRSPPLGAVPPEKTPDYELQDGFRYDRFGVRVPTLLISPHVEPGTIFRADGGVPFDHTSIIKTIGQRWNMSSLTDRDAAAPHVGHVLTRPIDSPRDATPAFQPRSYRPIPEPEAHKTPLSQLHRDILAVLAAGLADETPELARAVPKLERVGEAIAHFAGHFEHLAKFKN